MSEGRKRSRKSKIEVRADVDVDDTENSILQKQPAWQIMYPKLLDPKPSVFDHTYSLQHATQPSSTMQLSVKVEVEEFDESIIGVDSEDTNDGTVMTPGPYHELTSHTRSRVKPLIRVFQVNLEKIYKISEHIIWSSNNPADKYLSMEMKNIWGRVLKPVEDNDPYNELIQKALLSWGQRLINGKTGRESPIFYQCHICKLAWWHLTPFRDHIRFHDHKTLKVYNQENDFESIIVASDVVCKSPMYIRCEGNCYRCGSGFDFHVKTANQLYKCLKCFASLPTCLRLQQHMAACPDKQPKIPLTHLCKLCQSNFLSEEALDAHMPISHLVRSDIPSTVSFKTCSTCQKKYHHYYIHMCIKSSMNSACVDCYRKFPSKTLANIHMSMGEKNYKCRICNFLLSKKCMETEHMLRHTKNYRMVYKCINMTCSPTMLFPDEKSVRQHKWIYHKQKFDRRRTYFERVLVPEQCVKPEFVYDMDHIAACTLASKAMIRQVLPETQREAITQTDEHKDKEFLLEDVKIKEEMQELTEIVADDSQDSEMDYEQMLAKVFKVSETEDILLKKFETPSSEDTLFKVSLGEENRQKRLKLSESEGTVPKKFKLSISEDTLPKRFKVSDSEESLSKLFKVSDSEESLSKVFKVSDSVIDSANTEIQIKTEPVEISYEELIDIQDDPITIKKEPVDTTCDYDQTDDILCDIEETSQMDELCDFDGPRTIKTEPQQCKIDGIFDIAAVKIEPDDVKQELMEATDLKIIDTYMQNPEKIIIGPPPVITPIGPKRTRPVKKVMKSHKNKTIRKNLKLRKKTKLKQNVKENTDSEHNVDFEHNVTENTDCENNVTGSSNETEPKKMRRLVRKYKSDASGLKIQRVYTCTKCGYANNHRLYRIHTNSKCELSPTVDDENNYMCTKCDSSFGTLKSYLVHFQKHGYGFLHCPSCNMKFESLKEILPHFHKHIRHSFVNCWTINTKMEPAKKQNRCQTCHKIVPQESFFTHWESHLKLRSNFKVEPEPIEVDSEKASLSNKKALHPTVLHVALQQLRTIARDKECLVCHRRFSRRHDCKRHIIEHLLLDAYTKKENTPENTFRCQICLADFTNTDKYKFHMREHGSLPVYRCELCNKTFSDSSNFAKHKKLHSLKLLICDICLKKFHAKVSLERHMMMHQVTEPINCDLCTKQFYTESNYNKHMKIRHMRATRFRCILCDIWFDTLRKKWDHAWAVHKERKHKADCPICHQGFRKFLDVKTHALVEHNIDLKFYNIKSDQRISTIKMKTVCKMKKLLQEQPTETLVVPSGLVDSENSRNLIESGQDIQVVGGQREIGV